MPLHARQDSTRHQGDSTMSYEQEDNPDAYEATIHKEQGGVCHLVHGWIQQNMESRVFWFHDVLVNCIIILLIGAFHIG
jgi:hypothetical protein